MPKLRSQSKQNNDEIKVTSPKLSKYFSDSSSESSLPKRKPKKTNNDKVVIKRPKKSGDINENQKQPIDIKPEKKSKKKITQLVKEEDSNVPSTSSQVAFDSNSESEWEEVEEIEENNFAPVEGIEISLGSQKREKKDIDAETVLRREINRFQKKQLEEVHKAHLLGYIAHGKLISKVCSSRLNVGTALSMIPIGFVEAREDDKFDMATIRKFLKWFQSAVVIDFAQPLQDDLVSQLLNCIRRKSAPSERDLVSVLVCMLRSLGFEIRLMSSVHPASFKIQNNLDLESNPKKETPKKSSKKPAKKIPHNNEDLPQPDYWVELYLDSEEKWIALDPVRGCFNEPDAIESRCKQPVLYVLSFDNECAVRDLTTRYSSGYLSPGIRNQRCDHDWWAGTLRKLKSKKHMLRDRLEDMQLQDLLLKQPLPTTIAELKGHPLYVLKKDIRKFEAIYPPETKHVGFVRGSEVFPRNAVHLLRAKETWLKQARLIRVGEQPYKMVKARPKLGVPKEQQQERQLHLFGFWQTEPYIPKPAVDGKIPRNEYGNVDFFKPEMLPPGTVHLPIPGLLSIAKKLDVDCAPAMVGWEFTGRGSFPVFNGWIVCEEHKEALLAAWDHSDAHQAEKRAQKKKEKALENWRKLIRGVQIRAQVERKYRVSALRNEASTSSSGFGEEKDNSAATAWPQSQHQFRLNDYDEAM